MTIRTYLTLIAALFAGAALLAPLSASAGSCCGGGGGTALLLPSYYSGMIDISFDFEKYHNYWNAEGKIGYDPPNSDLHQYRLNFGYAKRLSQRWQTSITLPYVWNDNVYSGDSSQTNGLGDTTLNFWYEAVDDKAVWKVRSLKDMTPSVTIGFDVLFPSGISPYDDVTNSYDITGRGFYRLDGNVLVSKTVNPWNASLSLSYGAYIERPVNREYGRYVQPYRKKLGDRTSASLSLGYTYYVGTGGDKLTGTGSFNYLTEGDTTYDGIPQSNTGFRKESIGLSVVYASTDHDWSTRFSWSHAVQQDGWGDNFPITDIYTLGVSYGFR